jgi:hypothetical protein
MDLAAIHARVLLLYAHATWRLYRLMRYGDAREESGYGNGLGLDDGDGGGGGCSGSSR